MNSVIFREYDIRGIYNGDFDNDFAYQLGRAHISYIKKRLTNNDSKIRVSVGYDARISSPDISANLIRGMTDSGADVLNLGLITTPISYYSTFSLNALSDGESLDGAIMVTGSHNPPEYNGFKISYGSSTLFGNAIQELRQIIESSDFVDAPTGKSSDYDIFPEYVQRYKEEFKDLKPIPIVVDCGNGAAGCVVRKMYEATGLKPHILFEQPDGTFPNHHPDPTVEKNLTDLKKAVQETNSMIGIGFDGDADRIGVVDDQGTVVWGDELMVILAREILKDHPGASIIGDVKCSDRLYADIERHGGKPIMWKTGHSLVKKKIKDENSPFGGELSGHIFIADRNYGYDDALYVGLRLIEIMSKTGKNLQELLDGFGQAYNTPEIRIDTTEEKKLSIVEMLKKEYAETPSDNYKVNLIDGIRISYPDGWALARSSNTQPVLVLRFESNTEEGLQRIQNDIESKVNALL